MRHEAPGQCAGKRAPGPPEAPDRQPALPTRLPVDAVALKHWDGYTRARDEMFMRTHTAAAPWSVVHGDNKRLARLNLIRDILSRLHYAGKKHKVIAPDREIVFEFSQDCLDSGRLAR